MNDDVTDRKGETAAAERSVSVPLELIVDLWRYGNLAPVEGVLYNRSHRERLAEVDKIITRAYRSGEDKHAAAAETPSSVEGVNP